MAAIRAGCVLAAALAICPGPTGADEEPSASGTAARIHQRLYLSPLASYAFTDGGRVTDNGYGGSLAIGKQINAELALEVSGQYSRLSPASLYGAGINALFFPGGGSFYGLGGAAYGQLRSHPGNKADYGAALISVGGGWLWQPFKLMGSELFLRTEALYRLDAHSDRRTGNSVGNGRKAFNDAVFNVGLLIPLGAAPQAAVMPPAEAVQLVAVEPPQAAPAEEPPAPSPAAPPCGLGEGGQGVHLESCVEGDRLVLHGVNFETDQSRLTVDARRLLDPVADALLARADLRVEVGGHTDAQGSEPHNRKLSERRAVSVQDYLVSRGIAAERLSARGYGESAPLADNDGEDGRALNRRVELKIVESVAAAADRDPSGTASKTE